MEKNIVSEGCRDASVVWQDTLNDGHNRYEICSKHGIEYKTVAMEFADRDTVIDWKIDNQLGRRNLTEEMKSYLRGTQYEREKKKQGTKKPHNDGFQSTTDSTAKSPSQS